MCNEIFMAVKFTYAFIPNLITLSALEASHGRLITV